jgi:hypothetical protein
MNRFKCNFLTKWNLAICTFPEEVQTMHAWERLYIHLIVEHDNGWVEKYQKIMAHTSWDSLFISELRFFLLWNFKFWQCQWTGRLVLNFDTRCILTGAFIFYEMIIHYVTGLPIVVFWKAHLSWWIMLNSETKVEMTLSFGAWWASLT